LYHIESALQVFLSVQSARALSHAQMNRIDCQELAHRQTYSSSSAYGERRASPQACLRAGGMAQAMATAWLSPWRRHGSVQGGGMAQSMATAWLRLWRRHGSVHGGGMAQSMA